VKRVAYCSCFSHSPGGDVRCLGAEAKKEQAGRRHARGRDFSALPPRQVRKRGQRTRAGTSREVLPARQLLQRSIEFNKTIEGEGAVDPGAKMRAEFMMGKTLFKLKFFSASLSYFDRIVQKGPAHPNYNETLQVVGVAHASASGYGHRLEKIGKYNRRTGGPAARGGARRAVFLAWQYNYNKGKFQRPFRFSTCSGQERLLPTGQAF